MAWEDLTEAEANVASLTSLGVSDTYQVILTHVYSCAYPNILLSY